MTMAIERSWHEMLKEELQKEYIQKIKGFLREERERGAVVYPPPSLIFHAFSKTPFSKVKAVIIGQDPYHGAHQAHGLSFSVQKGIPIPPSLKNIYKELQDDLGIPPASHGCLEKWAEQGVLLLNATLTVRAGEPHSHAGKGWELFTDAVVEKLAEREDPMAFILWGKWAKEKGEKVLNQRKHPHLILVSAHPSPYSAANFFGSRPFSKINEFLKKYGKTPIDWRLN
ncbi:MAG: uracil-DNA glycosylase [Simkania negevensis]|nr:uracil-DNA glycosylase [Simkania negevensis]